MKDKSMLVKIFVLVGIVSTVAAATAVAVTMLLKKRKCKAENEAIEDSSVKDFEECCNACYSDCDEDI